MIKKLMATLLVVLLLSTLSITGVQAQNFRLQDKPIAMPADYFGPNNHLTELEKKLEHEVAKSRVIIYLLMQRAEQALQMQDWTAFATITNELNAILLDDLNAPSAESRFYAVTLLTEHIKKSFITPQDAQKAFNSFEKTLTKNKTCKAGFCDFLGLNALGLALSSQWEKEMQLPATPEGTTLSERARRLALFAQLLKNSYGREEDDLTVKTYLLRAGAYLGGLNTAQAFLAQVTQYKKSWDRTHLNRYEIENGQLQKNAVKTVAQFGPEAVPVLQDYAKNPRSLVSQVQAEIELAYLPLTDAQNTANKAALKQIYCHRNFNLDSQKDLELHQELAYAYGRGRQPEYVVATGNKSCLVVVPSQPDTRIVAKEWSITAVQEGLFFAATAGVGPVFSSLKNGYKVLRHLKTLRVVAAKQNRTLTQFFLAGGTKNLPKFGRAAQTAEAAALASAQAAKQELAKGISFVKESENIVAVGANNPTRVTRFVSKAKTGGKQTRIIRPAVKTPPNDAPIQPGIASGTAKTPQQEFTEAFASGAAIPNPRKALKQYPSGLTVEGERELTLDLLNAFKHSASFNINPYILSIGKMPAAKKVNLISFFANNPHAKEATIQSIRANGRLPLMFYDKHMVTRTALGASYFNSEMGRMLKRFATLTSKPYGDNFVEVRNLITSLRDYNFKYGFNFEMDAGLVKGLRTHYQSIYEKINTYGVNANPQILNQLWFNKLPGVKQSISLDDFFAQLIDTKFSVNKTPNFLVNSSYWSRLEKQAINQTPTYIRMPGAEIKWTQNPLKKAKTYWDFDLHPQNYMTLDDYAFFSRAGNQPVDFSASKIAFADDITDAQEIVSKTQTKGIKFCSMEKKDGIYGTGDWSNYNKTTRFQDDYLNRKTYMPIFLDGEIRMARTDLGLRFTSDVLVGDPIKIKTRKFFVDMPDRARALLSYETESNLLREAMPDIIATAKEHGGAIARWVAHSKYPPRFVNGKWYVDRRAVYLEKAVSPRAQPLFEAADVERYQMKVFKANENVKISFSDKFFGEEVTDLLNPALPK